MTQIHDEMCPMADPTRGGPCLCVALRAGSSRERDRMITILKDRLEDTKKRYLSLGSSALTATIGHIRVDELENLLATFRSFQILSQREEEKFNERSRD